MSCLIYLKIKHFKKETLTLKAQVTTAADEILILIKIIIIIIIIINFDFNNNNNNNNNKF